MAVPDDPGAIIVIALFYTDELSKSMLGFAAAGIGLLFVPSGLRVQRIWPYVVVGLFLPASQDGNSPAEQLDHALKPWVSWLILSAFGMVNAGVTLAGASRPGQTLNRPCASGWQPP